MGGADGFVSSNSSTGSVCKLGAGGVLTDPNADTREWCHVSQYANGMVEFTASSTPTDPTLCISSGRLCVTAKYKAVGVIPGYDLRADMRYIVFRPDMANFSYINMDYWFYGLSAIISMTMFWNLPNVRSMRYVFTSCTGLTELDLFGLDPSSLTDLAYAFSGCTNLATIYADSTWALPAGASGSQTFYNCSSLVGGAGTAYSSANSGYSYMRIDAAGTPGYLTASL